MKDRNFYSTIPDKPISPPHDALLSMHSIFRVLYGAGIITILTAGSCQAQFSRFEDPNTAPNSVSPLATLFGSINNVIYSSADYYGSDQTWDRLGGHYRGNLLRYLLYPELTQTGFTAIFQ